MKIKRLKIILIVPILIISMYNTQAQIVKGYAAIGNNLAQVDGDEAYGFYKFGLNTGIGAEVQLSKLFSASIEANFNQKGARKYLFNDGYKLNINYVEIPVMFYVTDGTIKFGVGVSYSVPVSNTYEYDPRVRNDTTDNNSFIAIYNKTDNITSYSDFRQTCSEDNKAAAYYRDVVQPWNHDNNKFSSNNFSIIADLSFKIWKNFKGDIRYSYSLKKIRTVDYYFYQGINFDNSNTNYDIYSDGDYANKDFFECFQRKEYHNCLTFRLLYYFNEKQVEKNKELQESSGGELYK